MLSNASLKMRLLIGFFMASLATVIVGVVGVFAVGKIYNRVEDVYSNNLIPIVYSAQIGNALRDLSREVYHHITETDDAKMAEIEKGLVTEKEAIRTNVERYRATEMSDREKQLLNQFDKEWLDYVKEYEQVLALSRKQQQKEAFELANTTGMREFAQVQGIVNDLITTNQELAKASFESSKALYSTIFWVCTLLLVGSSAVALTYGYVLSMSVSRALRSMAIKLGGASDETAAAAEQLSTASQKLAESASEQASSLQETAATVEEINSTIQRSMSNANIASQVATDGEERARRGQEAMSEVLVSMGTIEASNTSIMEEVKSGNERIGQIVKIINDIGARTKVINEIVFQTKLLSFNASVEAARAGEHGKGFAVVAEEVGNLAQMSGGAAKEIEAMLGNSVHEVETIVAETRSAVEKLVEEGRLKVEQGRRMVESCSAVLEEIVAGTAQTSHVSSEVAEASQQQAKGMNEISAAVSQLDQVTQENASTSEEAASAASKLSEQALELRDLVSSLTALVEGAHGNSQRRDADF